MNNFIKAADLLVKFTKEKLQGDLNKIIDFDFSTLKNSSEFGCPDRDFTPSDTKIMYAVYTLLWGENLPKLTLESCGKDFFGINICQGSSHHSAHKLQNRLGNFCIISAADAESYVKRGFEEYAYSLNNDSAQCDGLLFMSHLFMFEYCGAKNPFAPQDFSSDMPFKKVFWNSEDIELVIHNRSWQMWEKLRNTLKKLVPEAGNLCSENFEANWEYEVDAWRANLYSEKWLISNGYLPFEKSMYKNGFIYQDYLRFFDNGKISDLQLAEKFADERLYATGRQQILLRIPHLAEKICTGNQVWIYAYNDKLPAPPEVNRGFPRLPCLPEECCDAVIDMLGKAFPGLPGNDIVRLEDHIRHNEKTLLTICNASEADKILSKLKSPTEFIHCAAGESCQNPNSNLLPNLFDGQWKICSECEKFTLDGHTATCNKRWACKFGAGKPRSWDINDQPVRYHSQCLKIEKHFRFETAYLCYTERFEDEARAEINSPRLFIERNRLLKRDLCAALDRGNLMRTKKRCADLGISFAEFAAEHDISQMFSFWEINEKLLNNVKLCIEEKVEIPEKCREELLKLDGDESLRQELHKLLSASNNKEEK